MIEVTELRVCYKNISILTDISLSISGGTTTCIIGPNGCGKTTLLRALTGLVAVTSGSIKIDNVPVMQMSGPERAKKIAYLPQSRPIPDMTALTMVRHGRFPHQGFARKLTAADHAAVDAAVDLTRIEDFLEKPVTILSGGERQRVFIAMALAQGAETLLLDEPASGLDLRYQMELLRILKVLRAQGKTIVIVTHDLPMAFSGAERICLLNSGHLIRCAKPEDHHLHTLLTEVFGYALKKTDAATEDLYRYKIIKGESSWATD